jgi:hypothetical protein
MTLLVTTEFELNQVSSPNLPLATEQYSRLYQDQLNNVLRLYFNRLDSILDQLRTAGYQPPLVNYTVLGLPFASVAGTGARAFVTDALTPTFGAVATPGGAVAVPVYSDGTNWRVG